MNILPVGMRAGWSRRSGRIARAQFRALRTPLLVAVGIELLWVPVAGLVPDFGDPLLAARVQSLGFEAALPASLLVVFLGTLHARDGGTLDWLRLLSRHPFEIVLGCSLWGISSSALLLLAGSPSLILGLSGAVPGMRWTGLGLFTLFAVMFNLYFMMPLIAFQLWAVIHPEKRPGRDAFWLGVQFACGMLLAVAVNLAGTHATALDQMWILSILTVTAVAASPLITLFLLSRATNTLAPFG